MRAPRVSVQWRRSRIETPQQVAARMFRMLTGLAAIDDCFAHWYKQGRSLKGAYRPAWQMPPDMDDLARALEKAIVRDLEARVLGIGLYAWNGRRDGLGLVFSFYQDTAASFRLVPNMCEFTLPDIGDDGRPMSLSMAKAVLRVMADAWHTDYGGICSFGYQPPAAGTEPRPLFWCMWMTYLSAELAARFKPPAGALAETGPAGGLIIQLTEAPFDENDPHHVAMMNAMYRALLAAYGPRPDWREMDQARARLGWE